MLSKKQVTALAKKLAQGSFEGAEIDLSLVRAITQLIAEFADCVQGLLRRKYLHFLENECHWSRLRIVHVGICNFVQIQHSMERPVQRKLKLETSENIALIAGLRISVGDYVWERSIRGDLSTLCC